MRTTIKVIVIFLFAWLLGILSHLLYTNLANQYKSRRLVESLVYGNVKISPFDNKVDSKDISGTESIISIFDDKEFVMHLEFDKSKILKDVRIWRNDEIAFPKTILRYSVVDANFKHGSATYGAYRPSWDDWNCDGMFDCRITQDGISEIMIDQKWFKIKKNGGIKGITIIEDEHEETGYKFDIEKGEWIQVD